MNRTVVSDMDLFSHLLELNNSILVRSDKMQPLIADMIYRKFDSSGKQQWIKQIVSSSKEIAHGVAVDSVGNIYLTGYVHGSIDNNTHFGAKDIFLAKYVPSGFRKWITQPGFGRSVTKVVLSIKLLEEQHNKEAVSKFSSPLSGKNLPFSSLSDKLNKNKDKSEE